MVSLSPFLLCFPRLSLQTKDVFRLQASTIKCSNLYCQTILTSLEGMENAFTASEYYCEIHSKWFPLSSEDCYSYFQASERKEAYHCRPSGITAVSLHLTGETSLHFFLIAPASHSLPLLSRQKEITRPKDGFFLLFKGRREAGRIFPGLNSPAGSVCRNLLASPSYYFITFACETTEVSFIPFVS